MLATEASMDAAASEPTAGRQVLDQPLLRPKSKVSLSAFCFLFSEMVQYCMYTGTKEATFTQRLHALGLDIGHRLLEVLTARERYYKRHTNIVSVLSFVSSTVWKHLFGHSAVLLKGKDDPSEYMINDKELQITKFISTPKDLQHTSCAAFVAGIVEGILRCSEFPAAVSAHNILDANQENSVTLLIKFEPEVLERGE
ncbi:transport protein particle component, Bet3 domain-containing protein [Babesia caballi]|uniref:Trafficking protein particle complex subunit n=1 Tax=Babesia caballi TaxID=5871 RepID=A0AAV4LVN6_BABCB|nr:transport protein particle component, Bet3 domain-containing protein [Babesia caballi]